MPYSLDDKLVIAISSRALFDLEKEHSLFASEGEDSYVTYMREHENVPLKPGTGFPLVKSLLAINERLTERVVEVVIVSHNNVDSGLRIMKSARAAGLDITRGSFVGGEHAYEYLDDWRCKLFLSANRGNVQEVLKRGRAAALVFDAPDQFVPVEDQVRIAFDGDAVIFDAAAAEIFERDGLPEFLSHEAELADVPMGPGPLTGFLKAIATIQGRFSGVKDTCPIHTAVVTARNSPADERAIKTLRAWNVRVDEIHFLGGVSKTGILKTFRPHIYFDDQRDQLSTDVPCAEVCRLEVSLPEKKPAASDKQPVRPPKEATRG
ncbi:MAG TPA: 5'-nucleotidase [Candidatus Sulfotelmatobacter sp.]|nr:5'-nucleotidase [Candidatus Sulfotelmatobacter sp.]